MNLQVGFVFDRDTEEAPSFEGLSSENFQTIDNELGKIEKLIKNADKMKNKMVKLIQTILGDPSATTDRFAEALEDALHVQVVIQNEESDDD